MNSEEKREKSRQCIYCRCKLVIPYMSRQPTSPSPFTLNTVHLQQFGNYLPLFPNFRTPRYLPVVVMQETFILKFPVLKLTICTTLISILITTTHAAHPYEPSHMTSEQASHAGSHSYIREKHTQGTQAGASRLSFYKPSSLLRCFALASSYETLPLLVPRNTCARYSLYDATAPLKPSFVFRLYRYHPFRRIVATHSSDFFFFA